MWKYVEHVNALLEELQECQQKCLDYAQRSGSSGQLFLGSLSECHLEPDLGVCDTELGTCSQRSLFDLGSF